MSHSQFFANKSINLTVAAANDADYNEISLSQKSQ